MRVFLSSRVSTRRHQRLNDRIAELCTRAGLSPFVPQHDIPESASSVQILEHNEVAVDESELVITVFDTAGAGVALELGRARARHKLIIGFRSRRSQTREQLGMMLEGAWADLPQTRRASSLAELRVALQHAMSVGRGQGSAG
jgi:nucleoside 2-deoxyribosyltransferase